MLPDHLASAPLLQPEKTSTATVGPNAAGWACGHAQQRLLCAAQQARSSATRPAWPTRRGDLQQRSVAELLPQTLGACARSRRVSHLCVSAVPICSV